MSDDTQERTQVKQSEDGIEITVQPRFGDTVEGWEESREDLGLNKHGDPVADVELVSEEAHFYNKGDEIPRGYGPVTLRFPDTDSLEEARDHLYEQATQRFEWGADGEAVQTFVGRLPTAYEVEQTVCQERNDGN